MMLGFERTLNSLKSFAWSSAPMGSVHGRSCVVVDSRTSRVIPAFVSGFALHSFPPKKAGMLCVPAF